MGKIQIFKTFGLSQILYCGILINFDKFQVKKLNKLIYRFIWNKNMDTPKAPDRIKRSILKNRVTNLGFGMIDWTEVLDGLRVKSLLKYLYN